VLVVAWKSAYVAFSANTWTFVAVSTPTSYIVESKLADVCVSGIEATFVYCIVQQ
jgi:hypothetical protein